MLGGTAQAADTMLGPGRKTSNWTGEGAIHTGAAGHGFHVPALFEYFLDQEFSKPNFTDLDQKAVGPGYDIRCGLGIDMIPLIMR
jgi:hypothetical protein